MSLPSELRKPPYVASIAIGIGAIVTAFWIAGSIGSAAPTFELPPKSAAPLELTDSNPEAAALDQTAVSRLFVKPAPPRPVVVAKPRPMEPPPIPPPLNVRFIGEIVEANGDDVCFFKDDVSGRVVVTRNGTNADGWKILERNRTEFTVMVNGIVYKIPRK